MSRPARKYDPKLLELVGNNRECYEAAQAAFWQAVDDAIHAGVPLRTLEDATGVSRSTLSRRLESFGE